MAAARCSWRWSPWQRLGSGWAAVGSADADLVRHWQQTAGVCALAATRACGRVPSTRVRVVVNEPSPSAGIESPVTFAASNCGFQSPIHPRPITFVSSRQALHILAEGGGMPKTIRAAPLDAALIACDSVCQSRQSPALVSRLPYARARRLGDHAVCPQHPLRAPAKQREIDSASHSRLLRLGRVD